MEDCSDSWKPQALSPPVETRDRDDRGPSLRGARSWDKGVYTETSGIEEMRYTVVCANSHRIQRPCPGLARMRRRGGYSG